jgi:hypothetical protein
MLATLLFLLSAVTEPEIVVRRSAAQPAIERILKADNLDIDRLSPREVSDRMKEIGQGASPDAFWQAYQAHVAAWTDYADALEAASKLKPGEPRPARSEWAVGRARARINRTFETVELLARRYGARVPLPRSRL